jgi:FAD/FMN-containing dehydrogenase
MEPRVLHCRSVEDVVAAIKQSNGDRVVPRGGGHCFVDRSSGGDVVLDLTGLGGIAVRSDGVATVGAGAHLGQVYAALHASGRGLPAGCGETVGITGLTLGGGIGLVGRKYGLTCDRLVGAQVVLADGSVVECDADREPDLFWALRGAGGGQFGVVTSLRFDTVPEPITTRLEASWVPDDPEKLVAVWQAWAPDSPDELTLNLALTATPGKPVAATLSGASVLREGPTWELLRELRDLTGARIPFAVRAGLPLRELKRSFADPHEGPERAVRIRSEFFADSLSDQVLSALLTQLRGRLAFTAMGGAYNRVATDATAFAHRNERFLLEHLGEPAWIDTSWAIAHADGSGRVYPNFPDLSLADGPAAYHGENLARLRAVKQAYDPDRFFDFPQAV